MIDYIFIDKVFYDESYLKNSPAACRDIILQNQKKLMGDLVCFRSCKGEWGKGIVDKLIVDAVGWLKKTEAILEELDLLNKERL